MDRRQVLASLATGISMGSISGCLGIGENNQGSGPSPPAVPSETPPLNSRPTGLFSSDYEFDPVDTFEKFTVEGRPDAPDKLNSYELKIWNGASIERTVWLRILDQLANEVAHKSSYAMPPKEQLVVTLEPSRYYVQLWGPAINTETVPVPCTFFDSCNDSSTHITISTDGHIWYVGMSTLLGCPVWNCSTFSG